MPRWDLTKWLRSLQSVRLRRLQVPNLVHALGCLLVFCFVFSALLSLAGNMGLPHPGKVQGAAAARAELYPFPFVCVQTVVWLPVFGIFNVHTDADACDCTQGLYRHCKRVCTES